MSLILVIGPISRPGKVGRETLENRSFQIIFDFGFQSFILLIHLSLYVFYLAHNISESDFGFIWVSVRVGPHERSNNRWGLVAPIVVKGD